MAYEAVLYGWCGVRYGNERKGERKEREGPGYMFFSSLKGGKREADRKKGITAWEKAKERKAIHIGSYVITLSYICCNYALAPYVSF